MVAGPGDSVHVGPGGHELGVHVSHLALDQLELADPLAKLLPLVDVVQSLIQRGLHQPS